jgi:radical SAM protein with 4Fe4S-binding SPASM domain
MMNINNLALKILKVKNLLLFKRPIIKAYKPESEIPLDILLDYNENRKFGYAKNICNAPHNSLYFSVDGNVLACCKNRSYKLGHITQNSIMEIWKGSKIASLRDRLKDYRFDLGCNGCKEGICASKYANVMAASYDDYNNSSNNPYPIRMDFELSATCNLACIMCDGHLSSTYRKHFQQLAPVKDLYDETFLTQLTEFLPYLKKANFLGGEPFLFELNYKIWEELLLVNDSCNIHIQTNGHILNNKVKSILEKGRFSIGMSLESLQKNKFENIRLYGNYEKFIRHFRYFKAYCKKKNSYFNLAISPLRTTIDELADFISFANTEQVAIYLNTVLEPHDLAIWSLPSRNIHKIIEQFKNISFGSNNIIETNNISQFHSFLNQLIQWEKDALQRENNIMSNEHKSDNELVEMIIDKLYKQYIELYGISEKEIVSRLKQVNINEDYRSRLLFFSAVDSERVFFELMRK